MTLIDIQPAKKFILFVLVFYLATFIFILCCNLAWLIKLLFAGFVLLNARKYCKQYLFQSSPRSALSLWKTQEDFWCLQFANSQTLYAFLKTPSFVTQFLMILKFYTEERRKIFIIITPECIGKNEYRHLMSHLMHS